MEPIEIPDHLMPPANPLQKSIFARAKTAIVEAWFYWFKAYYFIMRQTVVPPAGDNQIGTAKDTEYYCPVKRAWYGNPKNVFVVGFFTGALWVMAFRKKVKKANLEYSLILSQDVAFTEYVMGNDITVTP